MKKSISTLSLSLLFWCSHAQLLKTAPGVKQKIDTYLQQTMAVQQIPGMAVAVIQKGQVIYEAYYGKASLESNQPVNSNTLFPIFSTTKLISATGVFQLIEKGRLHLEDNISKYIDSLPAEWQDVKIKNLLTHSSGLPDVALFDDIPPALSDREKITRLSAKAMQFKTGNQFSYNQTNYWLLTQIIEKITGQPFEAHILNRQFPLAKKGAVVFSSDRGEVIPNRASRYNYDRKAGRYVKNTSNSGVRAHSGNGLNLTLRELIRWNEGLDKNKLLQNSTKLAMWQPFDFSNKKDRFLYGWGIYEVNKKPSFGFSGGNVTAFRKFTGNDVTVIFLSNGSRYFDVQDEVINHVAGLADKSLIDEVRLAGEQITNVFLTGGVEKGEKNYLAVKQQHPDWNFENSLNRIGYVIMNNRGAGEAIRVFQLNVNENPQSSNAFDSFAEAYFNNGDLEISKQHYKKSLALGPENTNAKEMIEKIEKLQAPK
jgi:CubicO group peptidase (beta-lactamase class C family)